MGEPDNSDKVMVSMTLEEKTKPLVPAPLWCSCRLTLAFISFLGFVNLYALRVNLSVAMVCMLNHTALSLQHRSLLNTHTNSSLPAPGQATACDGDSLVVNGNGTSDAGNSKEGEFVWPREIQGLILGSFFWGYLVTQVPGGWLSARLGGKRVFGYFMCACAVVTLLMPVAARADYRLLLFLRFAAGVCQGVVWPAMQTVWAKWTPPLEAGKLQGFCYAGSQIGNVLTFPIAALLCEYGFDGGWASVFYVLGGCGLLWFAAWMLLVFDSPDQHPRISAQELEYIQASLRGRGGKSSTAVTIPWRSILTSKPVWAIVVTHTCANWGTYTFLTNIPTYLKEVLRFDIKKSGLVSSLPYIGFWLVINISGHIFDMLQSRGSLTPTAARKIGNSMGLMLPAVLVLGVGFMDCHSALWGVVLLTVGVAMSGCQYGSGFIINPGDIAPRYAGIIFGISNTFATIPGFLAPTAIGYITSDQTQGQWQIVFFICAAIYVSGAIFYMVFGTAHLQGWACEELVTIIPEHSVPVPVPLPAPLETDSSPDKAKD
ncbi:sialin-like isoform X1 [Pomacea canaliculata]|nr:sialin-like isoform X1 [Pomacea canaliculata]XP_025085594.1 sialin-like isoform X1 [Pomacea canaliculata]XP_025085595.1 sialin-like isoform X1 [Pomacea canaliculata]XP_025085596.1 sialin-like isoform X1 [Pomacea canaliculata]XP_025085597.1 sialin-like isoform X1 [Pomacea canaliculata]XP_025085598.1 sialin-like isoform X1 [Pomacea canaliculata]XP_025085599.1 sialin-like isoform X1 [Pomacea canaliculata]